MLGSFKHILRDSMVVIVSIFVLSESLRDEPARAMCLLSLDNQELQRHEEYNAHGSHPIRLLVQEILPIYLQVKWHEALHGK